MHNILMENWGKIAQKIINKIPKEVSYVTETLEKGGYEAYLVGGCVRDLVLGRDPKDWDVTTNATPGQIESLFEKTVYENKFGTVAVVVNHETPGQMVIEVTPFRLEGKYTDNRHPDEIKWSEKLEDDLKRRDFTVNAMSLSNKGQLTDIFGGIKDIENRVLRTVGEPDERFREDALRMLRAVRFSLQLGFSVSHETSESIIKNSDLIKKISAERIADEFVKIINSDNPSGGIVMLERFQLLKNFLPELIAGIGCMQSGEHIYDVWEHGLRALQHAADKNWPQNIRLAALFHDIGKPKARREEGRPGKKQYTFYGHEVVGARMTKKIMERLKFPKKETELVEKLVRYHMFFSDTEQITLSAVRRIITKVGREHIWDLMKVRECDRVGTNKKETSYRLRKYHAMIEEALRDPISVAQLKINGEVLIKELGIAPGPRMGWILNALLEEVLDDPSKNTAEHLKELTQSLNMLGDGELKTLGERGKEKKEKLESQEIEKIHSKHRVKKK